ncbi:hypothetical protein AAZX31_10G101300 [Glycine max]
MQEIPNWEGKMIILNLFLTPDSPGPPIFFCKINNIPNQGHIAMTPLNSIFYKSRCMKRIRNEENILQIHLSCQLQTFMNNYQFTFENISHPNITNKTLNPVTIKVSQKSPVASRPWIGHTTAINIETHLPSHKLNRGDHSWHGRCT